jgi:hypothetical protein
LVGLAPEKWEVALVVVAAVAAAAVDWGVVVEEGAVLMKEGHIEMQGVVLVDDPREEEGRQTPN